MKASQHFLYQRLTAIVLFIMLPFIWQTIHTFAHGSPTQLDAYCHHHRFVMMFLAFCVFYHAYLGLHVIIDDYVPLSQKSLGHRLLALCCGIIGGICVIVLY